MFKKSKVVVVLSLSIVLLGSSFSHASSFRSNYNMSRSYKVDSNFYDTYTNKNYNYNWDVSIWNRLWEGGSVSTPSVPVQPRPESPKPEAPVEPKPESPKPQLPSVPESPKPEVPSIPEAPKPVEPKPEKPSLPPVNNSSLSQMESEVIRLVNIERAKNGLSPFTASNQLSNIARLKSQDMADNNYFSHQSPRYGSPFDMLKSHGVNYKTAGENIAKGYNSAESVVRGWMNSQGHRENILNGSFNTLGVGTYTSSNGTIYWTQLFTN